MFEREEQPQIRNRLVDTTRWIVGQRLLPRVGGGRVAAMEILCTSLRVKDLILNGETEEKMGLNQAQLFRTTQTRLMFANTPTNPIFSVHQLPHSAYSFNIIVPTLPSSSSPLPSGRQPTCRLTSPRLRGGPGGAPRTAALAPAPLAVGGRPAAAADFL